MVNFVHKKDKNFAESFLQLLNCQNEKQQEINATVKKIIEKIKKDGDDALIELTRQFDNAGFVKENIRISDQEIDEAFALVADDIKEILYFTADRIRAYQEKLLPQDIDYKDEYGVRLGNLWKSIDSIGVYVPGGLASYPSSVLMNVIPAKVANVSRIAMAVPCPGGKLNNAVLAAARIAGVDEIYRVGGVQAIAAFAFGTDTIRPVKKIVGPGNAYVATAKKEVFGAVGIDMIAGPSEIVVITDGVNIEAKWVATDLLSQAEHDPDARAILITDNEIFAHKVKEEVEKLFPSCSRKEIAQKSWNNNGAIIIIDNMEQVVELCDKIAPEHVEIIIDDKIIIQQLIAKLKNVGAIFIGAYTPEAIGDYTAGPSHVLPTSGSAAFSSGLSVFDFLRRVSLIECNAAAFNKLSTYTENFAKIESLPMHALSVSIRTKQ